MKIYTKTGDQGETGLLGGKRVSKSHPGVEACGSLDELNCWIGLIRSQLSGQEQFGNGVDEELARIQNDLFFIGTVAAGALGGSKKDARLSSERVRELEDAMDQMMEQLPEQTAFILPGGNQAASSIHLARSVCRRAERALVYLQETDSVVMQMDQELIYLNRLADWLFLFARKVNFETSTEEVYWIP